LTSDKWGVRLETAEDAFFTNFERLRLEAAGTPIPAALLFTHKYDGVSMLISLQKPYDGFPSDGLPSFGLKTKIPLIPLPDWRRFIHALVEPILQTLRANGETLRDLAKLIIGWVG